MPAGPVDFWVCSVSGADGASIPSARISSRPTCTGFPAAAIPPGAAALLVHLQIDALDHVERPLVVPVAELAIADRVDRIDVQRKPGLLNRHDELGEGRHVQPCNAGLPHGANGNRRCIGHDGDQLLVETTIRVKKSRESLRWQERGRGGCRGCSLGRPTCRGLATLPEEARQPAARTAPVAAPAVRSFLGRPIAQAAIRPSATAAARPTAAVAP